MANSGDGPKVARGKDLFCPRDGNPMAVKETGDAILDVCGTCGGQFFDHGEMFAAFGLTADPSYWDRPETGGAVQDGTMPCPRCKTPMLVQHVEQGGDRVEIDRCRACNGIWLDGGEVKTVMAISEKMIPVIDAERAKARAELAHMEDMRPTGLIGRFFRLFWTT